MMSLDERIRRELENDADTIDAIVNDKRGIVDLGMTALKGGMGRWMIVVTLVTLVVTVFMLWSGYRFFVAEGVEAQVFWGVWFLASLCCQIALKQWTWMEMNRVSLLREVKRVEIALEKMKQAV